MVSVRAFGYITDITGWAFKEVSLQGESKLGEILEKAMGEGAWERVASLVGRGLAKVLLNGAEADLSAAVRQEDEVAIIPLPSGG